MRKIITTAGVLCMFLGTAVQASIQIINPVSLRDQVAPDDGFIDNGMANFGHIDYGISIVSAWNIETHFNVLIIAGTSLCTPDE